MKNNKKLIICLFFNVLVFSYLHSQSSMFGTNPEHTGFYNSHFRPDIKLVKKWSFKTNGKIFSTAAISNDMIFIGSDDSCLYAISTDGNLKWKFKSTGKVRSAPALKDTLVYFNNYDSMFYALGVKSGKVIWSYKTEGESTLKSNGIYNPLDKYLDDLWDCYQSSPVISDSIIYFGCGKNMYALNLNTKAMLWKYAAGNVIHSSPAVSKGVVFFGCWDKKLYALDALNGKMKWTFTAGDGIPSSPSVVDTIVYIGSRDANVYGLSTRNGKQIWATGFSGSWMPSSFAVSHDTIYTGSSDAKGIFGINKINGALFFSTGTNCFNFSTPAITNETGFIGCMNGSLFAFNRINGRILAKFDTDARKKNYHNAVKDDGSLNPYYFDPVATAEYTDAIEYNRRLCATGSIFSTPVISDNTVYFGSTDSCLYAVYDDGSCRPNISVRTGIYDLGTISKETVTSFYVRNDGDCPDSVKIYFSTPDYMKPSVIIEPQNLIVNAGDSVKVNIKVNCSGLKPKSFQFIIGMMSKSNRYKSYGSTYNFKVFTELNSLNQEDILQIYPNPFSETTTIKLNINQNSSFKVAVYNVSGQEVKELSSAIKESGEHTVTWDGTNNSGAKLPSGVYILRFVQGATQSKELITIK